MYKRVGRTLLMIGQHCRQKLGENPINTLGVSVHSKANNYIFQRTYCSGSSKESEVTVIRPPNQDEEAAIKLKEYLADPDKERKYKVIELEIEVLRQNNDKCPAHLRTSHWWELLQLDSYNKRKKYLTFLWTLEKRKENVGKKKIVERDLRLAQGEPKTNYRLGKNTYFLRIYEGTINHLYHSRLMNAMLYGQPIVMDCSYDAYMTRKEAKNCAKQLQLCFATNRIHNNPFDMIFCNVEKTGDVMQHLHRSIPTMYDSEFPLQIKTESYLDLFDKDRVIYLTPHCPEEMTEFDHDAIYVIGAYVDKSTGHPVSFAKGKKLGLKMRKLPLDRYLQWGQSSSKNLTLNAVVDILLDLRATGSWDKALLHVPRRKLVDFREAAMQREASRMTKSGYPEFEMAWPSPVQPLGFKDQSRFNNPKIRAIAGNEAKLRFNKDINSNIGEDSRPSRFSAKVRSNEDLDFSSKGRAKLKKNY